MLPSRTARISRFSLASLGRDIDELDQAVKKARAISGRMMTDEELALTLSAQMLVLRFRAEETITKVIEDERKLGERP